MTDDPDNVIDFGKARDEPSPPSKRRWVKVLCVALVVVTLAAFVFLAWGLSPPDECNGFEAEKVASPENC